MIKIKPKTAKPANTIKQLEKQLLKAAKEVFKVETGKKIATGFKKSEQFLAHEKTKRHIDNKLESFSSFDEKEFLKKEAERIKSAQRKNLQKTKQDYKQKQDEREKVQAEIKEKTDKELKEAVLFNDRPVMQTIGYGSKTDKVVNNTFLLYRDTLKYKTTLTIDVDGVLSTYLNYNDYLKAARQMYIKFKKKMKKDMDEGIISSEIGTASLYEIKDDAGKSISLYLKIDTIWCEKQ